MAKRGRTLPARRARGTVDDSRLIRSAESLGRMIGLLQRQLDGAARRISSSNGVARLASLNGRSKVNDGRPAKKKKKKAVEAARGKKGKSTKTSGRTR